MKKYFFILFCLALTNIISALEINKKIDHLVNSSVAQQLIEKGYVQNMVYRQKGVQPSLVPSIGLFKEAIDFWKGDDAPFFIETLYLFKKVSNKTISPVTDITKVSVILRSLSRLRGLEYYSTSRKKMHTLYEESYVIDNIETKKRISDPISVSADNLTILAIQKDLTFGKYVYEYKYRQTKDAVAFFSSNLEALKYSFVTIIEPDNLHTSLVVYDLEDYFLIYGLTKVKFFAFPGMEEKINASFTTRIEAIYNWFIKEYEKQ